MAWKFYTDSACTNVFTGVFNLVHKSDFSDNPQDLVLYLAEVELDPADNGSYKLTRADSSNIEISILDSSVGTGHEATEIKLATSLLDLDSAVAGATLSLGLQVISGVTSAQPIHIRVTNAVSTLGVSSELSLRMNECIWTDNI